MNGGNTYANQLLQQAETCPEATKKPLLAEPDDIIIHSNLQIYSKRPYSNSHLIDDGVDYLFNSVRLSSDNVIFGKCIHPTSLNPISVLFASQ